MAIYITKSGHEVIYDDDVELPGKLSIGSHGYAQLTRAERGTVVLLHRWLLGLSKGDGMVCDHINGNRLDCRRKNLRLVTPSENSANTSAWGALGVRGVSLTRNGKYAARANYLGYIYHLGTYPTLDEADEVAHQWRVKHMPGYTGEGTTRHRSPGTSTAPQEYPSPRNRIYGPKSKRGTRIEGF